MITIGIRSAPKVVCFAVFDSDEGRIVNVESILVPAAFYTPDALKYIRSNILDVLREYNVEKAGIRVAEGSAQNTSTERIQIEGVVQEAFASSTLKGYYVGYMSNISSKLGIRTSKFKELVKGANDLEVEGWEKLSESSREAILCAMGAVHA